MIWQGNFATNKKFMVWKIDFRMRVIVYSLRNDKPDVVLWFRFVIYIREAR